MEPFVYQTIHLFEGRARLLDDHLAVLERTAAALFGVRCRVERAETERRLTETVRRERYPAGVSGFVRIEATATGAVRLRPCGPSLYAGYAVRSLRPEAVTIPCERLLTPWPTSASEAADALLLAAARRAGADAAVRCDADGRCRAIGDAPLFAVRDGAVFGEADHPSVEAALLLRALARGGIRFVGEPLRRGTLGGYDELFAVDHRGITALSRCDGHPCMAIVVERLAAAMEAAVRE